MTDNRIPVGSNRPALAGTGMSKVPCSYCGATAVDYYVLHDNLTVVCQGCKKCGRSVRYGAGTSLDSIGDAERYALAKWELLAKCKNRNNTRSVVFEIDPFHDDDFESTTTFLKQALGWKTEFSQAKGINSLVEIFFRGNVPDQVALASMYGGHIQRISDAGLSIYMAIVPMHEKELTTIGANLDGSIFVPMSSIETISSFIGLELTVPEEKQ